MNPTQPASAEYVFAQLNQLPAPYSLPGAAVWGHTKIVNTMGATTNNATPPHTLVRPNSLNAIRANTTNSQIAHTIGSDA